MDIKREKIKKIAKNLDADRIIKTAYTWNGADVYSLKYNSFKVIGLPHFILVKGNNVRLSTDEETFAIINKYYVNDSK